ncbi:hypothetical protein F2Q69_00019695 [Brassica cretica]|uniref:Uncharacterized protein n=1 Tax=Brassica cretica TaxID=69181 RepID=A0A8S9QK08_BRACR|nr:hypothetical protein F2Q69_00019695 [Brassica cretica]
MASISVIGVSDQLMILKDKKVLYLKMHLVLFCLRTSGSPSRPPNGVFLVISPSPLPCAFIPTNWRNTSMSCARRLNRTEALCLLSDVCSNTLNQNECDDNILRFISVTNYWLRHGNVEVRGFDTIKPFSLSSDSIVLNVPMKAKLAFEIHLVSLRSFVEFKTDRVNFSIKSSHIGLLPLGVVQGPGASHQKLLAGNNPAASYWCINVDFDYQLFLRTIALGIRVKLLYGVLHLAELDSPLIGFIFLCFIMLSTFHYKKTSRILREKIVGISSEYRYSDDIPTKHVVGINSSEFIFSSEIPRNFPSEFRGNKFPRKFRGSLVCRKCPRNIPRENFVGIIPRKFIDRCVFGHIYIDR